MCFSSIEGDNLQIVFMVYDSRSGSTFLSKKISEELDDVIVTPELGFDSLFRCRENVFSKEDALSIIKDSYRVGDFRNLNVNEASLERAIKKLPNPIQTQDIVQCVLEQWLKRMGRSASRIIIKNGSHARYWRKIKQLWPQKARFIFVFRDPRAVVNSKLRTVRPYHSHEVMAWGGTLLAAWRWRSYAQQMRKASAAGLCVLDVQYERLVAEPEVVINEIAVFLGAQRAQAKAPGSYEIPTTERGIHTLVAAGSIVKERAKAWIQELSSFDRSVIESVCNGEMMCRGYSNLRVHGKIASFFYQLAAIPQMLLRVFRHYLYRLINHGE
ncbi:MAG: sulfotransferase [Methanobacteriota archaeon]|nr:MAG: sulfotransferase [Euryarchaeota archaeon]